MARRAAKADANQHSIVKALRKAGASVMHLHGVGGGCPDLLVGKGGNNLLMEVKDGSLVTSAQKLNEIQTEWHDAWRGQVCVVRSEEEALDYLGRIA